MAQQQHADKSFLVPSRIKTNPWLQLVVLTMGFFMILLDTTIVIIAIPHIETGLHATFDEILWVLNAYTLTFAVLLLTAGRLGDMFGPRRLFIMGLVVFTIASAACGLSQTADQLILFRVIQGIGGAMLTPQTLGMLPRIFPPEKRGAAFGVWGAVSGVAAVIGPTLGGFLVTAVGWESIFFINIPVGIATMAAAWFLLPEVEGGRRHKLDIVGTLLATGGLFFVIFALIEGQAHHWGSLIDSTKFSIGPTDWSAVSIYSFILYGLILLVAFIYYESVATEPLLPLRIFRDRNFGVSNIAASAISFAMAGLFVPLTIFLESVRGFSAVHTGFTLIPMSLMILIAAPISGRLSDRINGKYIVMFGLSCAAFGVVLMIHALTLTTTSWDLAIPLGVAGLGMGCTFAPLTALAMRDVELAVAGVASGVMTTTRQVGQAMGSAVVGAVLANAVASGLPGQAAKAAATANPKLDAPVKLGFLKAMTAAAHQAQSYGAGQSIPFGKQITQIPAGIRAELIAQLTVIGHTAFANAFLDALAPSLGACAVGLAVGAGSTVFMRGGRSASSARMVQEPIVPAQATETSELAGAGARGGRG